MNREWSKFYVAFVILILCAAFGGGCTAQVDTPESDTEAEDGQLGEAHQTISGGGACHPSDPNWPRCARGDGPSIPSPSCTGKSSCYCFCRIDHPCRTNPSQCGPLGQCLTHCDSQYPNHCSGAGHPENPTEPIQCL